MSVGQNFPTDDFLSEFGMIQTYIDPDGVKNDIALIIDKQHVETPVGSAKVANNKIQIQCKASDVANANNKAKMIINDITYNILRVEPDGTGWAILDLSLD